MYLVTGATGNVGRPLVRRLLAAGAEVRASSRRPSSADLPDRVELVSSDDAALALEGVVVVFVNPGAVEDRLEGLLDLARQAGVRRVVLLSTSAVLDDANPIGVHHRELERLVRNSGLEWVALRPGIFNSNALAWSAGARAERVVRTPFATARIAPIDEQDVAAVAARALLCESGHGLLGTAPVLSGPEVLTPADQVRIIGQAVGVPLRLDEVSSEAMREAMIESGVPSWAADGLLRYYARAMVEPVEVSPAVAELTGHPPRSFASWVADHVATFRAPPAAQG